MIFKNYGDFLHTDQTLTSYDEQKALVYFQSSATNSMYKNTLQCKKKPSLGYDFDWNRIESFAFGLHMI